MLLYFQPVLPRVASVTAPESYPAVAFPHQILVFGIDSLAEAPKEMNESLFMGDFKTMTVCYSCLDHSHFSPATVPIGK